MEQNSVPDENEPIKFRLENFGGSTEAILVVENDDDELTDAHVICYNGKLYYFSGPGGYNKKTNTYTWKQANVVTRNPE